MPEKEAALVVLKEKQAEIALHASIAPSWFGELINKLDEPLSRLMLQGNLTSVGLDGVLQNWILENGDDAKRVLWFFHDTQYNHPDAFGFLVADLEEEGRLEEVEIFYDALKRERDRT